MVALKIPSASARGVSSHVAVNQVNQLVPEVKVVMSHMRSCIDKENSPTERNSKQELFVTAKQVWSRNVKRIMSSNVTKSPKLSKAILALKLQACVIMD